MGAIFAEKVFALPALGTKHCPHIRPNCRSAVAVDEVRLPGQLIMASLGQTINGVGPAEGGDA